MFLRLFYLQEMILKTRIFAIKFHDAWPNKWSVTLLSSYVILNPFRDECISSHRVECIPFTVA